MAEEGSSNFSLIKLDGKPIEKLIETVSAGIGVLYKPRAIRKEAEAKAFELEKIAEAKAKSSIIKYEAENEIAERARQRLYHQEMQRQINIDNIVDSAAKQLSETVSEQPVDDDWRTRFFIRAKDISSEDLQTVWAKILANEIRSPGSFSLRTLDLLSNLSKTEAEIFNQFLTLCTNEGNVIKFKNNDLTSFGISFEHLLILRSIGLLYESEVLSLVYSSDEKAVEKGITAVLHYSSNYVIIHKENTTTMSLENYALTSAGVELLKVLAIPSNLVYLSLLTADLEKHGYESKLMSYKHNN